MKINKYSWLPLGLCLLLSMIISTEAWAQSARTVTGTVVDQQTQETLIGVTVKVKNKAAGVSTDATGKFSIQATNTDVLVITYLGYEQSEITVGSQTNIAIRLNKSLATLDEVVVVGYGSVAKRDVTGAIASVTAEQIAERSPVNIFDAIQGQAGGVQVDQVDGRPGAESSIIIRGVGTLGAGAGPLYIVDGAQGVNIDGINPNDVERIEILKDAASSAIYGSRGANGVIIITTKRGVEGKPQIAATMLTSFSQIAHKIAQANADERRLYETKISNSTGALTTDSLNPGFNADNDAFGLITRTAIRNEANLTMSGASKSMKYYAGGGYITDEGVILNSWMKQARFRMNLDYNASEKLVFSSNLQFSLRNENVLNEGRTLLEALERIPTYAVYMPDGSLAPTISGRRNPLAQALLQKDNRKTYDANLYNKVMYKFTPAFSFTADATLRYNHNRRIQFTPRLLNQSSGSTAIAQNAGIDESGLMNNWQAQTYFNYNKTFGSKHSVAAVLGASAERFFNRFETISATDFLTEEVISFNSAQQLGVYRPSETASSAVSGFTRFGYTYNKKYTINGILRADGSSRFGIDNRWGFFPSVSAAWNFSEEKFLSFTDKYLTDAKLRGGYGIVGNDRIGQYDAIQRYVFGTQFYNGVSGVVMNNRYGNNKLGWETNKQLGIGLDLVFFDGRFNFTADYYDKVTSDLLYTAPMVVETGFTDVNVNTGSIQNKGFEFQASGYPIRKNNFSWNVAANITFNRGTVRSLLNGIPIFTDNRTLIEEGKPLGNFFGWKQLGVYAYNESNAYDANWNQLTPVFNGSTFSGYTLNGAPYNGAIKKMQTNGVTAIGGDAIWLDLDKNGIIDDLDRHVLGNAQPKWFGGITNAFDYKNFGLSFNIYASMGGEIYNAALATRSNYSSTGATPPPQIIRDAWHRPGDITMVPDPKTGSSIGNTREVSSRYIENGSFIRLRNVKISYSLPRKWISPIGIQRVAMFVQGDNLATLTNYSYFDPEMAFNDPLRMGIESNRVPRKNALLFGLNVNF